jgi:hypothetical protein
MSDSIREQLEAAFDEQENEESGGSGSNAKEPVGSTEKITTPGEIIDGETPSKTVESGEGNKDEKGSEEKTAAKEEVSVDKTELKDEIIKSPAGWSPEAREVFKDLSPVAQKEIIKREKDYAVGLQRNAETSKFGTRIKDVLAPFQAVMRMEGADEISAVESLASVATTLRMGTPMEKAREIARLIGGYGIDIATLDDVLSGQIKQVPEEEQRLTALMEKHLAPVRQILGEVERGRAEVGQRVIADVDNEIAQFESKAEFIEDVRNDMADFLEMAAKNGRKLTLQEAYDKAVTLRPDLSKIIQERSRVSNLKDEGKRLDGKRKAASSVHGSSAGTATTYKPGSDLKRDVEAAWEASERQ